MACSWAVLWKVAAILHVVLHILETALQLDSAITYIKVDDVPGVSAETRLLLPPIGYIMVGVMALASCLTNVTSGWWTLRSTDFSDHRFNGAICAVFHACQLGQLWRYFKIMIIGEFCDVVEFFRLRALQTCLQDGVYVVLQVCLLLHQPQVDHYHHQHITQRLPLGVVVSFLSLCSSYLSCSLTLEENGEAGVRHRLSYSALRFAAHGARHVFMLVARLMAMSLLARAWGGWVFLIVGGHVVYYYLSSLLVSVFVPSHDDDDGGGRHANIPVPDLILFSVVETLDYVGLVHRSRHRRRRHLLIYYEVMLVENAAFVMIGFFTSDHQGARNKAFLALVFCLFVLGAMAAALHEVLAHRRSGSSAVEDLTKEAQREQNNNNNSPTPPPTAAAAAESSDDSPCRSADHHHHRRCRCPHACRDNFASGCPESRRSVKNKPGCNGAAAAATGPMTISDEQNDFDLDPTEILFASSRFNPSLLRELATIPAIPGEVLASPASRSKQSSLQELRCTQSVISEIGAVQSSTGRNRRLTAGVLLTAGPDSSYSRRSSLATVKSGVVTRGDSPSSRSLKESPHLSSAADVSGHSQVTKLPLNCSLKDDESCSSPTITTAEVAEVAEIAEVAEEVTEEVWQEVIKEPSPTEEVERAGDSGIASSRLDSEESSGDVSSHVAAAQNVDVDQAGVGGGGRAETTLDSYTDQPQLISSPSPESLARVPPSGRGVSSDRGYCSVQSSRAVVRYRRPLSGTSRAASWSGEERRGDHTHVVLSESSESSNLDDCNCWSESGADWRRRGNQACSSCSMSEDCIYTDCTVCVSSQAEQTETEDIMAVARPASRHCDRPRQSFFSPDGYCCQRQWRRRMGARMAVSQRGRRGWPERPLAPSYDTSTVTTPEPTSLSCSETVTTSTDSQSLGDYEFAEELTWPPSFTGQIVNLRHLPLRRMSSEERVVAWLGGSKLMEGGPPPSLMLPRRRDLLDGRTTAAAAVSCSRACRAAHPASKELEILAAVDPSNWSETGRARGRREMGPLRRAVSMVEKSQIGGGGGGGMERKVRAKGVNLCGLHLPRLRKKRTETKV